MRRNPLLKSMTDEDLKFAWSDNKRHIEKMKKHLADIEFEIGYRETEKACKSKDPYRMCLGCDCWKSARAACS